MKNIYIINGPNGIGKSTISSLLLQNLSNSVWLDGDWCWMSNTWPVNEETKAIVESNIKHCLYNFAKSKTYESVVFSWIIRTNDLYEKIVSSLNECSQCKFITLFCSESELATRHKNDNRDYNKLNKAIEIMNQQKSLPGFHIDTTSKTPVEIVEGIIGEKK